MCRHYDVSAHDECLEDDAERVREKEQLNFCDYYVAAEGAFDPEGKSLADAAKADLDALFGESRPDEPGPKDPLKSAAEDLFK